MLPESCDVENALRPSEEHFRNLADAMPHLVWTANAEGAIVYYNSRSAEYRGLEKLPDGTWNWHSVVHPEDLAGTIAARRESAEKGTTYQFQNRLQMADGSYRWHLSRAAPVRGENGVVKWFGTATDIHDTRKAQEAVNESQQRLTRANAKLEQRVEKRTAELQEQTKRLRHLAAELTSAEQRERKRLAALLHDDLQQLLVAANMQIEKLSRHVTDDPGAVAVEQAAKWIAEAIAAARGLTRALRPPVLYEAGLVAALHWLASEMEERHGLKVVIQDGKLTRTLCDDMKALIFECVRELLFNVAKYARVGRATVDVREDENGLKLIVADEGRGFGVAEIDEERHRDGFGLFSIRERLAALGGKMTIASAPGNGTRVELEVALSPTAADSSRAPVPPANARGKSRSALTPERRPRVLVVDDHAMVREGIANIVEADERLVVVAQAADGIQAIEAVEEHQPDVVLMDVNMPRMNGIEATREIRRRHPSTIVIGLSVQDDEATAKSMLDAGAAAFLPKAGDSGKMISTIFHRVDRWPPAEPPFVVAS